MPATSGSVLVNSGVPDAVGLLYKLKVTVPVGLSPPVTVAWSAIVDPSAADAGCCVVESVNPEENT